MRHALLLCALLLPAAPATAGTTKPPVEPGKAAAAVKLAECVPALEAQDRSATFEARMRALSGSERMQLRFTLQVSEGVLPGWRRVAAPGLDQWLGSAPGVSRYSYSKTVLNLSAPAEYRTVVRFRWLDSAGETLKRARVTSRACRQPDMRPDLTPTRIERAAGGGYAVTLHNEGRTDAGPFALVLSTGESLDLPGLEAGEERVVTLPGAPLCAPGEPLAATADATDAVDERDEADNSLATACLP
jgi:hypothetical protein